MLRHLVGFLVLLAAPGAALACSCIHTTDEAEIRRFAREDARRAIALVEVETLSGYDQARGRGELLRVRRTLAGRVPMSFRVERPHFPSSASCDLELRRGERRLLLIYPGATRAARGRREYRISGLCTESLLAHPAGRATMIAELRRRR